MQVTAYHNSGRPSQAALFCAVLLIFLLVAMPKGGVKIDRIPITFSYLTLGVLALPCLAASLRAARWGKSRILAMLLGIPLVIVVSLKVALNGYYDQGFTLALFTNVAVLPFVFMVCFRSLEEALAHPRALRWLVFCVGLVTAFGIVEFLTRNFAGIDLEVPYITVNSDDVGRIAFKHNLRTNLVKLMSTYNNGNIFGICMLLLGPVFFALRPGRLLRFAYTAAVFLTLSRTVWAGMLAWLVLWEPIYKRRPVSMLIKSPVHVTGGLAIAAAGLVVLSKGADFLLDSSLGGRLNALPDVQPTAFGWDLPFLGIGELTYTHFLQNFGVVGLVAFLLWLASPVIASLVFEDMRSFGPVRRGALVSLAVYMIVSAVDGAFLLIPVIAIYWLVASYLLNPSLDAVTSPRTLSMAATAGL